MVTNPLAWIVLIGIVGVLVVGSIGTLTACRDVTELQVEGSIVELGVDVRTSERTVTTPACPTCPGSQPRTTVAVTTEEIPFVVVSALEEGTQNEFKVVVDRRTHAALAVGDTVLLNLRRSVRDARLCGQPTLAQ